MVYQASTAISTNNNNEAAAYEVTDRNSYRTQWLHQPENGVMYRLPKALSEKDEIVIEGILNENAQSLIISLVTGNNIPDYNNVACQIEFDFLSQDNDKKTTLKTIVNGDIEETFTDDDPPGLFPESNFTFRFHIVKETVIDTYVEPSFLLDVPLKHNLSDISFLTLNSKVKQLKFIYG